MTTDDNKLDYYVNGVAWDAHENMIDEYGYLEVEDSNSIEFLYSLTDIKIDSCTIGYKDKDKDKDKEIIRSDGTSKTIEDIRFVKDYAEEIEESKKGYTKE